MTRIHRVAWRHEKPRRFTVHHVAAIAYGTVAFLCGFGWIEPTRFLLTAYAVLLLIGELLADMEARDEYRQWLRLKAVGAKTTTPH